MKKIIAIFCGSFNPPLKSHFLLAKQVLEADKNIEKIIFIPVSSKYYKKGLIEDKHRYTMLKLMCKQEKNLKVSDIEIKSKVQPYTIQTLRNMRQKYKKNEIYLIIGTDNLKELETWYKAEELLTEFKIFILKRNEDNIENIIKNDEFLNKHKQNLIEIENLKKIDLSSTLVRDKIKLGEEVSEFLNKDVLNYIKTNKLYKV